MDLSRQTSQSFLFLVENMLKDRLSKISGWQFHKWLFGPEMFSGPSRNGPQDSGPHVAENHVILIVVSGGLHVFHMVRTVRTLYL